MAVNQRLPKERLNLDPGLLRKTMAAAKNHIKLFLIVSQRFLDCPHEVVRAKETCSSKGNRNTVSWI